MKDVKNKAMKMGSVMRPVKASSITGEKRTSRQIKIKSQVCFVKMNVPIPRERSKRAKDSISNMRPAER